MILHNQSAPSNSRTRRSASTCKPTLTNAIEAAVLLASANAAWAAAPEAYSVGDGVTLDWPAFIKVGYWRNLVAEMNGKGEAAFRMGTARAHSGQTWRVGGTGVPSASHRSALRCAALRRTAVWDGTGKRFLRIWSA